MEKEKVRQLKKKLSGTKRTEIKKAGSQRMKHSGEYYYNPGIMNRSNIMDTASTQTYKAAG
jgi:hypothetical protein